MTKFSFLSDLVLSWRFWVPAITVTLIICILIMPKPLSREVYETTHHYTGRLGMVSYRNSWFGLGSPEATTLSFLNSSIIREFTINKYISVEIGKTYTVEYNITTTFYNVPDFEEGNPANLLLLLSKNTTKLTTISVIENLEEP